MICTQCQAPLDEADAETVEQINKYAALPILPICEACMKRNFNEIETVQ